MSSIRLYLLAYIFLALAFTVNAQTIDTLSLPDIGGKTLLNSNWVAKWANEVKVDGNTLTAAPIRTDSGWIIKSPPFWVIIPPMDLSVGWMPARVPGTALTTMLGNKVFPPPEFGMNNELIPDLYNTGAGFYTFWYLRQFTVEKIPADEKVWLNFRGINYKAEIFLNGRRVNKTTLEGMFLRRSFDITHLLSDGKPNVLAVIVYPPDHPGNPNGGQSGDGTIARDNTMQYMPGYDWCRPIRDRNTGIWDEVSITTTKAIRIQNPYVVTKVPGVRQVEGPQKEAYVKTTVELENTGNTTSSGTLICETSGQRVVQKVSIPPNEKVLVALKDIIIKAPRLWWPNGIGRQDLYDMKISFEIDGQVADVHRLRYGIREITSDIEASKGGRRFYVNGQKIFITGGNYISSDWLLRLSPERYRAEIRFAAEMNLRMIRVWGGAMIERPEFYDACDEYGILVFQDLWGTGDCIASWDDPMKLESGMRRREYPDGHDLYLRSAKDQIKMIRNHPSLCFWSGANETPLSDDLNEQLANKIFPELDPHRLFINYSTDPLLTGGGNDGPYEIQEPERFFAQRATSFNPEEGSVGLPEIESLREIMNEKDLSGFPVRGLSRNYVWSYHLNLGYAGQLERYGSIDNIETYCKYAQLVNYDQYRSMMEGAASKMWTWYTGILLWKIQNPWTALRGQTYDWFLDVNASLYGIQKGCELLHPFYNPVSKNVELLNASLISHKGLLVKAQIYNVNGEMIGEKLGKYDAPANTVAPVFTIAPPANVQGLYFLKLSLYNGATEITDNIYWLSTKVNDYTQLEHLPLSKPDISLQLNKEGDHYSGTMEMTAARNISFFNRIKVLDRRTGKRILPVHYSDNYITLMPGDKKIIRFDFSAQTDRQDISVIVDGLNGRTSL